jgi:hypothetical protein
MIIELVAATVIFAAGYKWGSNIRAAAIQDLQHAEASAEAELADLKAKIASSAKAVVPAVVAEVKAAL